MNGKLAGIAALVLSVVAGVAGLLYFLHHHPRRGLVLVIGFVLLLALGILFVVRPGKKGET